MNPESRFVCRLDALTPEDRVRKEEVSALLRARVTSVRELPDGFEFELAADASTLPLVGEWMWTERLCCPFFDLSVQVKREGGPIAFRLVGPPGVKQFVRAELESWLPNTLG